MRSGFSLIEVVFAVIILGLGLAAILTSMSQAQNMLFGAASLETAQEVMDLGEMAYPLEYVKDPSMQLDVQRKTVDELWKQLSEDQMPYEQAEKYSGYTWEREWVNRNDEDEVERLGGLCTVKVTVRWGDDLRGNHQEESYVTFWRKKE